MRTTCSRSKTKILPSPIFPVLAAFSMASMTRSSKSSLIAASILTLGRKSTTYSAPRYSSVWPFCRPKPLTSVTVIPCTPMADSASRTSSSLNGLMMAVTSFIFQVSSRGFDRVAAMAAALRSGLQGFGQGHDQSAFVDGFAAGVHRRRVEEAGLLVSADESARQAQAVTQVVGCAHTVVHVVRSTGSVDAALEVGKADGGLEGHLRHHVLRQTQG